MVRDEEDFAQNRLTVAVRDFGGEIGLRVVHEVFDRRQVGAEGGERLFPGGGIRLGIRRGSVVVRPLQFLILRVADEIEDVPLREAQVFE